MGAPIVRLLTGSLGRSCRLDVARGAEHFAGFEEGGMVISFWHDRSILAAQVLRHELMRRGIDLTLLVSQSRDGELMDRLARGWGIATVRGSASRGGTSGLRKIYRRLRAGSSPVMTPDGPRGPKNVFKIGVAVLSQMAERPVLPMGIAVSRSWKLRSWDQLLVPKPFARVVVLVGEPVTVPRGLDDDELEAMRIRLETTLDALTHEAERSAR